VQGDDDQVVPIPLSALRAAKLIKDATLKVYPGAPHRLAMLPAWKDEFSTDLLQFLKS
jgi:non-heme chloroperoxidase